MVIVRFSFLLIPLINVAQSTETSRLGIFVGTGLPELIQGGVKYQWKQLEGDAFFGSWPAENKLYSIGGHLMWHCAGESRYLTAKPWYVKTDVIFNREESTKYIWKTWFSGLRFGRECAFGKHFSLQIDLGLTFVVDEDKIAKQPNTGYSYDINIPVFPAGSIVLFTGW
jgi:hypothetical protein